MTEILSKHFFNNVKDKLQNVKSTSEAEVSLHIPSLTIFNNILKCQTKQYQLIRIYLV